jgi:hypothetical protein
MTRYVIDSQIPRVDENDVRSSYDRAEAFISRLKEKGVEASIIPGGIGIYPTDDEQIKTLNEVCEEFNAPAPHGGETLHEFNISNPDKGETPDEFKISTR